VADRSAQLLVSRNSSAVTPDNFLVHLMVLYQCTEPVLQDIKEHEMLWEHWQLQLSPEKGGFDVK